MIFGGLGTPLGSGGDTPFIAGALGESASPATALSAAATEGGSNARRGSRAAAETGSAPEDGLQESVSPAEDESLEGGEGEEPAEGSLAITQGPPPVFIEYEVQPGDTVSQIAERFGISSQYVVWNNVNVIDDADMLPVGASLQIPGVEGIIHSARLGDTVSDLAVEYDSTTEAIVSFESNGFGGDANNLPVGALILIPDGRRVPPPVEETAPGQDPSAPGSPWTPPPLVIPTPAPPAEPPAPSWVWPATGRLTNVFGPRHPLGIDISMVVNTPIAAASGGQVTFVGGNPCCSYGYHVIVKHADGVETLYAHLSQIYVSTGQWVGTGEIIAASGNTGYSTGPHLHFEIRRGGVYVNPLGYLP